MPGAIPPLPGPGMKSRGDRAAGVAVLWTGVSKIDPCGSTACGLSSGMPPLSVPGAGIELWVGAGLFVPGVFSGGVPGCELPGCELVPGCVPLLGCPGCEFGG